MTEDFRVAVEDRVIMFMDIHDFSIALNTLGDSVYDFLQEVCEELAAIIGG